MLLAGGPACGQGTFRFTATFDGYPPIEPDSIIRIAQYFEGGMWFRGARPPDYLVRCGGAPSDPWWPRNGTAYLLAGFQQSLLVSSVSGRGFGVASVDLSEFNSTYATPLTVPFVGYRSDGATVTTSFLTDGIIDGAGPLADFQTFYFDARFDDLIRLEVPDYGWALDNMVIFSIPEPGVAPLVLLAAALLACRRPRLG